MSEDEYEKYKNLMLMHINYLLMRDTMKIAARYDKQTVYFYNLDFAKTIDESLDIADATYADAIPYWKEVKKYAERASKYKITTELSNMESERFSIMNGDTNFDRIIANDRTRIKKNKAVLAKGLSAPGG